MNSVMFTEDEFKEKAQEFSKISVSLHDNWNMIEKDSKIYLSKKQIISIPMDHEKSEIDNEDKGSISQKPEEIYSIEYHVVFHPNYQIPVLYFNAFRDDGKLINLEDVSKIFTDDDEKIKDRSEIHKIISQAEHPVLLKPFYMIHPCHIHEVLSNVPESENFIYTFLQLFGHLIRLKMKREYEIYYMKETTKKCSEIDF